MSKPKVLQVGEVAFAQDAWKDLESIAEVVVCTSKTRDEFISDLKTKYHDVTCITRTYLSVIETGPFNEEIAAALPDTVRSLSHTGAGYDQIDVACFSKRGIQVSNVTEPVEAPTALTAVYLTLACLRNFQRGHDYLMTGEWNRNFLKVIPLGREPPSQVVGILGMGGIGRTIRDRLTPFGFKKFIYHNRLKLASELEGNAEYVTKDELYAQSDVIIVGMPLNKQTHHIVDEHSIAKMKTGVIIVNIGRGPLIDEAQLLVALKEGKVGSFGADVWEHEPDVPKELRELPQVVSLPHMGTYLVDAFKAMEEWVVDNVRSYLETGKVKTIVAEQSSMDFSQH